ncbi:hypothetical protein Y032_0037g3399 [Ancylostoma ceylanicum]|uniref:Uncharacterized protein n=1 Tax=Ancylostoma ceylanicum TaxID=53326 RepID=A0A016UJ51_9BILA|nr:hypothetical protein Y032_0037g3399 [Ancylostoma ceylanicum]
MTSPWRTPILMGNSSDSSFLIRTLLLDNVCYLDEPHYLPRYVLDFQRLPQGWPMYAIERRLEIDEGNNGSFSASDPLFHQLTSDEDLIATVLTRRKSGLLFTAGLFSVLLKSCLNDLQEDFANDR